MLFANRVCFGERDFISLAAVSGSTAAGVVLAVVQPVQV